MQNFTFHLPSTLIFGPGEIRKVGREAKKLGKKALIEKSVGKPKNWAKRL